MKLLRLTIALSLVLPILATAAAIPGTSDVMLRYSQASDDQQTKYTYLFSVNDDPALYACQTNLCSMADFKNQGSINLIIYKLPDGFPRVTSTANQEQLRGYTAQAQVYHINNVATNLTTNSNTQKPYQLVTLRPDGSSSIEDKTYVKTDPTADKASGWNGLPTWLWLVLGLAVVGGGAAGFILWRLRQLQS